MNQTEIESILTVDFIINHLCEHRISYSINNLEK